jgi:hypothetical protein
MSPPSAAIWPPCYAVATYLCVVFRPQSCHFFSRDRPTPLIYQPIDFVHGVTRPQLGIDCDKVSMTCHWRTGNFDVVCAADLYQSKEHDNGDRAEKHDKLLDCSGMHELPP